MKNANDTPNWQLIALTPELGDISFPINVSMSVGRQDSNDVVLATPQISRQHAKFNQVGKNLFIQDLGSSNGTFVNGERIGTQAVKIEPDDEIAFADLIFVVSQAQTQADAVIDEKTVATDNLKTEITSQSSADIDNNDIKENRVQATSVEPAPEVIYKISDSSNETINPKSSNEPAVRLEPVTTVAISTQMLNEEITTNNVSPTPVMVNTDKPITAMPSESNTKKSPIMWIIAVIILAILIGMLAKGL